MCMSYFLYVLCQNTAADHEALLVGSWRKQKPVARFSLILEVVVWKASACPWKLHPPQKKVWNYINFDSLVFILSSQ